MRSRSASGERLSRVRESAWGALCAAVLVRAIPLCECAMIVIEVRREHLRVLLLVPFRALFKIYFRVHKIPIAF